MSCTGRVREGSLDRSRGSGEGWRQFLDRFGHGVGKVPDKVQRANSHLGMSPEFLFEIKCSALVIV